MKTLIVEDDFTSRTLLQELLNSYGEVHIAVNGKEAVEAARAAVYSGRPYDLVCLDIMMPEMDGYQALKQIRAIEEERGVLSSQGAKIFMTTALDQVKNVIEAFRGLCDAYLFKPIDKAKLIEQLKEAGLV